MKRIAIRFKKMLLLSVLIILSLLFLLHILKPKEIQAFVEIPQNTSTKDVAMILSKKKIIKNPYLFMLYVKINGYKLAAGKYRLSSKMSYKEICDTLEKGVVFKTTIRFTIPEGYTVEQIAERLSKMGIVNEKRFLSEINNMDFNFKYKYISKYAKYKLEGFLFPDTYEVYPNTSEKEIIQMMLSRFLQVYESLRITKTTQLDDIQTVILASIVEKEAKKDEERPLIAGVFLNRLGKNMKLESCATVEYVLPAHKEVLSYADLKTNSYYNTYLFKGLPPSAICNPGEKSLKAALNPQKTDFLFFVAKNDGSHVFSKTFEEHVKAQKIIQEGKK